MTPPVEWHRQPVLGSLLDEMCSGTWFIRESAGEPVGAGLCKYIIRTDIMFERNPRVANS